jgi:hypothetical protein
MQARAACAAAADQGTTDVLKSITIGLLRPGVPGNLQQPRHISFTPPQRLFTLPQRHAC